MDSPLISSIFRTLFHRHRACLLRRPPALLARPPRPRTLNGVGARSVTMGTPREDKPKTKGVGWQPRSAHMYQDVLEDVERYPMVTAADLVNRTERPRRVKMWAREFIDGECVFVIDEGRGGIG